MVRLQFSVPIEYITGNGSSSVVALESEPSHPFIVVTNESQWEYSEGALLKKDAFPQPEVPWQHFANVLQVHYVRSTRQDLRAPARPLSLSDLQYIHQLQFKERTTVHQKDFDRFWTWLGRLIHKIRHQKPFSQLWLAGLVYGFISKDTAEQLLHDTPAGTFLIRFSERAPGKQAVAYRKHDTDRGLETRHFLISPNDKREIMSLPDFLGTKPDYQRLVKLATVFYPPRTGPVEAHIPKDMALADFYTKRLSSAPTLVGYENVAGVAELDI